MQYLYSFNSVSNEIAVNIPIAIMSAAKPILFFVAFSAIFSHVILLMALRYNPCSNGICSLTN